MGTVITTVRSISATDPRSLSVVVAVVAAVAAVAVVAVAEVLVVVDVDVEVVVEVDVVVVVLVVVVLVQSAAIAAKSHSSVATLPSAASAVALQGMPAPHDWSTMVKVPLRSPTLQFCAVGVHSPTTHSALQS